MPSPLWSGLKSIFHLCEAFFVISSLEPVLHIINPWAEPAGNDKENDPKYPEWDQITEKDNQAVLDWTKKFSEGYSQFLCLWIPLRKDEHYNRRHPIIREYPGEKEETIGNLLKPSGENTPNLEIQISRLLPQLRSLKSLHGYQITKQKIASLIFGITLEDGFSRLKKITQIKPNSLQRFNGQANIQITSRRKMTAQFLRSGNIIK